MNTAELNSFLMTAFIPQQRLLRNTEIKLKSASIRFITFGFMWIKMILSLKEISEIDSF